MKFIPMLPMLKGYIFSFLNPFNRLFWLHSIFCFAQWVFFFLNIIVKILISSISLIMDKQSSYLSTHWGGIVDIIGIVDISISGFRMLDDWLETFVEFEAISSPPERDYLAKLSNNRCTGKSSCVWPLCKVGKFMFCS